MPTQYRINEIFRSIQGEGIRIGTVNVFVRFSGCNGNCCIETHGFDCDTNHTEAKNMTAAEVVERCVAEAQRCRWVILTGGEPALQIDTPLVAAFDEAGFRIAIETNGSRILPGGIDWVTVSPKRGLGLRQLTANEVKYVWAIGQPVPGGEVRADYKIISPAFDGGEVDQATIDGCCSFVMENPEWRLGVQLHKLLGIR